MPEWQLLPVRDSEALAAQRRSELDLGRSKAKALAHETLEALTIGGYRSGRGAWVDWSGQVQVAKAASVSIGPDVPLPATTAPGSLKTRVTVGNLTTLGAARELVDGGHRPLALNFANGVTPGGGWLNGARAQEEYLCRSSALYTTIEDDAMYQAHRRRRDYESSAWAILTPDVPVFRADDGAVLDEPWLCGLITMAAPVASHVGQPRSAELMAERAGRLLEIAVAYGYTDLVLGAWGSGMRTRCSRRRSWTRQTPTPSCGAPTAIVELTRVKILAGRGG